MLLTAHKQEHTLILISVMNNCRSRHPDSNPLAMSEQLNRQRTTHGATAPGATLNNFFLQKSIRNVNRTTTAKLLNPHQWLKA